MLNQQLGLFPILNNYMTLFQMVYRDIYGRSRDVNAVLLFPR
jgi:hypothetical protein